MASHAEARGVVRALVEHYERLRGEVHPQHLERVNANITQWLESLETDSVAFLAPLLEHLGTDENLEPKVREMFATLTGPAHQTQVAISLAGVYALVRSFVEAALAPFVTDVAKRAWAAHPSMPLSPAEAAVGVLKGHITEATAEQEAIENGLTQWRFKVLRDNAGEPPGLMQLLEAYRRGIINKATLEKGILQSRIRNEWIPTVEALRYEVPNIGAILAGAVQNHLPDADARALFEDAGGNPSHYNWRYATAGRPPGSAEMKELYNRGEVTRDEWVGAIRESDIKNKYIDAIIATHVYLPPVRSIPTMLRHGTLSEERATAILRAHGVQPVDIPTYIAEGHVQRATSVRELSQSQVVRMYVDGILSHAEALAKLVALKFHAADATLLLELADDAKHERFVQAVLARTHALYVGHRITEAQARAALAGDQIAPTTIDDYLRVWAVERTAAAPNLTVAQWQGALRRGLVTHVAFDAAMTRFGYDLAETDILAGLAFPPPKAPKAKTERDLSASQIVRLWQQKEITRAEAHARLMALGYDTAEADEILALA